MGKVLAFVVGGAAAEDLAADNAGLEGRRMPEFKRFGWLDIVMAINHVVRSPGLLRTGRFGDDDGMPGGGAKARRETDVLAMAHKPLRAGVEVLAVRGLCGDAGEGDVIAEFVDEARLVFAKVINDWLHAKRFPVKGPYSYLPRLLDKLNRFRLAWS